MSHEQSPLPDDIDALKALVEAQQVRNKHLEQKNRRLITENIQYKAQVLTLQEQLNLALARRYAASSEKIAPNQLRLFDEAEMAVETAQAEDGDAESITIEAHTRKKRGRKALPDSLPRVDIVHTLDEAARRCPHDGQVLMEIGEVTSEQLDIGACKYFCVTAHTRVSGILSGNSIIKRLMAACQCRMGIVHFLAAASIAR
jgi:hypothetical protein